MDLSFYHTAIARLVKCGTQVSQTVGRDQTSLVFGKSGCHMHRSDIGQAVMVNHNISLIETKIDSDNIQRIFVYYTYNRTQLYTISPSSTVGIQLHVLAETCSCIPTILLGEI